MRFYTKSHRYDCGIDLHARRMYICVLDAEGQIRVQRNGPASREHFLAPPSCRTLTRHHDGTRLTRQAAGGPSPELRANWDWRSARTRRCESAGKRAPMGF
jgi:phage terminase large subunit-like protein